MPHIHPTGLARRDFLRFCSLAAAGAWLPAWGSETPNMQPLAYNGRHLVLIELDGGNDGLNTLVPINNDDYYRARTEHGVAIPANETLPLSGSSDFALHPALGGLAATFGAGEMALVHGVGYADSNRSHFRGIDIWNTGSGAAEYLETGWAGRLLAANAVRDQVAAEGTILRRAGSNPIDHPGLRLLAMSEPDDFISDGLELPLIEEEVRLAAAGKPGLSFLIDMHDQVQAAVDHFAARLHSGGSYTPPSFSQEFPGSGIGKQLRGVAEMICAGVQVPVHKVGFAGFDTHANQVEHYSSTAGTHANLLRELDEAFTAFRAALIEHGRWNDCLVMTYAEFGRRLQANASRGTDHGSAAVHLLSGGQINGGLYGQPPSLAEDDLHRGDPVASTDFRRLYTTAARFLDLDASSIFTTPFTPLPILPNPE